MSAADADLNFRLRESMDTLRLSHSRYMRNANSFSAQMDKGIAAANRRIAINRETLRRLRELLLD